MNRDRIKRAASGGGGVVPLGEATGSIWPDVTPDVPADPFSFLADSTAAVLRAALSVRTKCVVELGSFLGASTRLILRHATNARVFAIDHFKGPASAHRPHQVGIRAKLPTLYETFLVNCWQWRDRLVPVRAGTLDGMRSISAVGVVADIVFVDADHEPLSVWRDASLAMKLWPRAVLIGDDFESKAGGRALASAVYRLAKKRGRRVSAFGHGWRIDP